MREYIEGKEKAVFYISVLALFVQLFSLSFGGTILNSAFCILLVFLYQKKEKRTVIDIHKNILSSKSFFIVGTELILFFLFVRKWYRSPTLENFFSDSFISVPVIAFSAGLVVSLLSSYALCFISERISEKITNGSVVTNNNKLSNKTVALICFLSSFVMILFCSKSSFLYPFNDWDDANCFFTVGKCIMNGIVPYKQLFEQKGPLLYFFHGLASLISDNSFLGVFFLEIIEISVFLFFSYKTMELYIGKRGIWFIPILALISTTSLAYYSGDSSEEMCLPFLTASIWLILNAAKQDRDLSKKEALFIGVLSGCIFWIKFSIIGMYLGWYLFYAIDCVLNKKTKELFSRTAYVAFGVVLSTIPFILYFGVNNAIADWFEVYIWDNVFLYSQAEEETYGVLFNLYIGIENVIKKNPLIFYLCIFGIIYSLFCNHRKTMYSYLSMLLGEFFLLYIGGRHFFYYSFALNAFASFGFMFLDRLFLNNLYLKIKEKKAVFCALALACFALAFFITPNRYLRGTEKERLPQFVFAEEIKRTENATLLNYGFLDSGFYTAADVLPNCKAFCELTVRIQEMLYLQEHYTQEGLVDYIVTDTPKDFEKYELIKEAEFANNEEYQHFFLYRLK